MDDKIKLGISRCLLGEKVRYDAGLQENFIERVFVVFRRQQILAARAIIRVF